MPKKKHPIPLSPQTITRVQDYLRLVADAELHLEALRRGLEHLIESETGVNLLSDAWTLDLDHATLIPPSSSLTP